MLRWFPALPALSLLLLPAPLLACSLCNGNFQQTPTLRQEAAQTSARVIVVGTATKSNANARTTLFRIDKVLRNDPALGKMTEVTASRYIPTDEKTQPRFLLFCDVVNKTLDPYRGVPLRSAEAIEYVQKAIARDARDPVANLAFFFRYLEHSDKEVAADAFLEFAKASDQEIGQAARKLSPDKLRGWLLSKDTPGERLSVYALMLGACGADRDAKVLADLLKDESDRIAAAYDGILGGYIHLRPREGWAQTLALLGDKEKGLTQRLAAVRTLHFYHGWKPKESREKVMEGMRIMLAQGDLADLAVEDLRRWEIWDLTRPILAVYGKKGYDAPLVQAAIIRYALCCKEAAARDFIAERRRSEPDLVKDIEAELEQK
jgi:hypothetical protein